MSDTTRLRDALLADIHTTFCERSAVAMRNHTPQVTAHQVEALVAERLDALIEAAAAEARAGLVGVEALALAQARPGCIQMVAGSVCGRRQNDFPHHDPNQGAGHHAPTCHLYLPGTIVALAATTPAPEAVERPDPERLLDAIEAQAIGEVGP